MSLLDEYARNAADKEQTRIVRNLLLAGISPQRIAQDAGVPLSRVKEIEKTLNP